MTPVELDLKRTYISQAICIVSYERDTNIRYAQKLAEDCFGPLFGMQSQQTNVPDDFDPATARLIFQGGQAGSKQLLLSQVAAQFMLGFESASEKNLTEQLAIITRNAKDFAARATQFKPDIKECALILNVNYPNMRSSRDLMSRHLHRRFLTFEPIGEIAATSFKVGYLLPEQLFFNITADIYEVRKGQFKAEPRTQNIDISALPIAEQGFLVQIDSNSRPKQDGNINDLENILKRTSNYVIESLPVFMGFENSHE